MNFSTGELVFNSNFKNINQNRRSGLNATEVIEVVEVRQQILKAFLILNVGEHHC
jgi:hypothetical protein